MSAKKSEELLLVGITGKNASGKGEASQMLERYGYQYRSLSDGLREEAKKRGLDSSRETLIELGQSLRQEAGPGVLGQRAAAALRPGRYVVDSIRHPDEIDHLRKAGKLLLLAIDAPIELRFARAQKRGRNENAQTVEEFRTLEDRERTDEPTAQQLHRCFDLADVVIDNRGTVEDLEKELKRVLKEKGFPT